MRLSHTDWLHHRLVVTGPAATLADFQVAASGAGIIPWALDRDRMEEDLFHLLVAPPAPQRRRLSLAGARVLARQLGEAAEARHAVAAARAGHSKACPFDLYALLPVPPDILLLGPDHPDSDAWLWAHWGTTQALRHAVREPALPRRQPLPPGTASLRLSFWSADWTPWQALTAVAATLARVAVRRHADLRAPMNEGDLDPPVPVAALPPRQGSIVWEDPPRRHAATSPVLVVDGFDGPLDWLLEMARAQKIDLAQLSILALVEAFADAMEAAMTRAPSGPVPDLARLGDWVVMASDLALLRSRMLLPADTPDALTAPAEAELLRRQWLQRAQTADAASWLERQPQLGIDVFARGCAEAWRPERAAVSVLGQGADTDDPDPELDPALRETTDTPPVAGGDLTELLRACLVALRLPLDARAYQLHPVPFWSISDAAARIALLLEGLPEGARLEAFVPAIAASSSRPLRCRAAVASTFVAGLELTRDGGITLDQEIAWHAIHVQRGADSIR